MRLVGGVRPFGCLADCSSPGKSVCESVRSGRESASSEDVSRQERLARTRSRTFAGLACCSSALELLSRLHPGHSQRFRMQRPLASPFAELSSLWRSCSHWTTLASGETAGWDLWD